MTSFNFHPDSSSPPESAGYVFRIPRGVDSKDELLRLISRTLRFPGYFGFNWDALDECLGDLSWLEQDNVVIWHEDLPLSSAPEQTRRYLEVLRGVLREPGNKRLTVSFPEWTKASVEKMVS